MKKSSLLSDQSAGGVAALLMQAAAAMLIFKNQVKERFSAIVYAPFHMSLGIFSIFSAPLVTFPFDF